MLRTTQPYKRRPLIGLLIAAGIILGQAIPAQALNFGFEFFNVNGNVNGSVTGRILGLNDNAVNQAASSVIIDTLPEVFSPVGSVPSPGGFGINVLPWTEFTANNFSVVNGVITSYNVRRATGVGGQLFFLSDTQYGGEAFFGEDVDADEYANELFTGSMGLGNPQNVIFTPISQPNISFVRITAHLFPNSTVPEPSTILLLGSGLVGMVAWRIRKH